MNSKKLIADLGGKDNIESISHCMTRIRIKVKNPQSVNRRQIAGERNVIKEQFIGHEYQIIVSNNVEKEFASLQKQMHSGRNDFTAIEWKTIPSQILVPILSLYTTAAISQGVLVLIKLCNLVTANSYGFLLNLIRLPVFCLPIIIGYSTAKSVKLKPIAGIGFGIELMAVHHYFKVFPNYVGSLILVILVCLTSKMIFVFLDKKIRGSIGTTYNFTLGFIIASVIGILLLAPIGLFLGKLFSDTIKLIMLKVPVIAAIVSSILYLFLVIKGQHWWLTLLALNNLGALGYSWLFAFTSTAQFGQLGAVFGIAAIIAMNPEVMVFDEPTAGQDHNSIVLLNKIIQKLTSMHKLVITITHDMSFVVNNFKRGIVFAQAHKQKEGSPAEIFSDEPLLRKSKLEPPIIGQLAKKLGFDNVLTVTDLLRVVN